MNLTQNTIFYRFGLISQPNHHWIISLLMVSLLVLPVGYMTIKGLFGVLATICLIFSLLALFIKSEFDNHFFKQKNSVLIVLCLTSIPICIFLTQMIRGNIMPSAYDGPIRLAIAFFILLAIYKHKIDFSKILSISIPLTLLAIIFYALLVENPYHGRLTNDYLDPIIWGNYSMILGFMSLAGIQSNDHFTLKLYKLFGLGLGACISLLSGSRAGWVAAIVMTLILLVINRKKITLFKIIAGIILLILTLLALYFFLDPFKFRIDSAVFEFLEWYKDPLRNSGTSIRLNMLKISSQLFMFSPWIGFGEFSNLPLEKISSINTFADSGSIFTIQCCGPHNDLAAHALKFGLLGIFSFALTFLAPIYIFLNSKYKQHATMGITLNSGILVCGFFSEMLTLKINYTFYAVLMCGLIATTLWKSDEKN